MSRNDSPCPQRSRTGVLCRMGTSIDPEPMPTTSRRGRPGFTAGSRTRFLSILSGGDEGTMTPASDMLQARRSLCSRPSSACFLLFGLPHPPTAMVAETSASLAPASGIIHPPPKTNRTHPRTHLVAPPPAGVNLVISSSSRQILEHPHAAGVSQRVSL